MGTSLIKCAPKEAELHAKRRKMQSTAIPLQKATAVTTVRATLRTKKDNNYITPLEEYLLLLKIGCLYNTSRIKIRKRKMARR